MEAMEGSDSPEGSGSSNSKSNGYLGVKRRHSGKISKVVKRSVIQPPKQQTPLYTIHKNDFRTVVQKLTGSPTAPPPPPPSPPPPPPDPPRLQRVRPPPLESVYSFNKLVSNPNLAVMKSVSFPSYQQQQVISTTATADAATLAPYIATAGADSGLAFQFPCSGPSPQIYPPLQGLPPSRVAWPSAGPRTVVSHVTLPSEFSPPIQFPHYSAATAAMAQQQGPPPLFLQSPGANTINHQQFPYVSPLPSPGSQFALSQLLAASQVSFSPGSLMPPSPTEQFQFGQLPPPSPGSLFSFPPPAHLPSTSF